MKDLVPPDEIFVPLQAAISFDIAARDGVITTEHRYLLATPEHAAADEMCDALKSVKAKARLIIEGIGDSTGNVAESIVVIANAALALADKPKEDQDCGRREGVEENVMIVTVVCRDLGGWRITTPTIKIANTCPECGGPRGEPYGHNFYEMGDTYFCHRWDNPCGHVDKYDRVLKEVLPDGH